jgi:phosphoribosylanthranilate isomerase
MKIKVCGIASYEDAKLALDCGADALGFNFAAQSPRFVRVESARAIVSRLPTGAWIVGIFCNHSRADVERIARAIPLDTIQLHGDESPRECEELRRYRVIKAFRMAKSADVELVGAFGQSAQLHLYDGFASGRYGGTGVCIDPAILDKLAALGYLESAFLSGGLNPENVALAVTTYRPFGVDVASGVESAPGRKSPERVRAFVSAARAAAAKG